MNRIVCLIKRLPNQSRVEFQKHWLEKHARLIVKRGVGKHIKRYAQAHTIDNFLGDEMQAMRGTMDPYDGVCELWVDAEQMRKTRLTQEEKDAEAERIEDEAQFIDSSHSISLMAKDHIVVNENHVPSHSITASTITKIFYAIRRPPFLPVEEFQNYWLHEHSQLIRKHSSSLGIWRYIDGFAIEDPIVAEMKDIRNETSLPFDGYIESWVDLKQLTEVSVTQKGKHIWEEIVKEEGKFIDFSHSSIWLAQEHLIYEDKEFIFQ